MVFQLYARSPVNSNTVVHRLSFVDNVMEWLKSNRVKTGLNTIHNANMGKYSRPSQRWRENRPSDSSFHDPSLNCSVIVIELINRAAIKINFCVQFDWWLNDRETQRLYQEFDNNIDSFVYIFDCWQFFETLDILIKMLQLN